MSKFISCLNVSNACGGAAETVMRAMKNGTLFEYVDYMDCGLYGFLLLRFLEKESAQRAAARNPKGDKSGRGPLGGPAWP